MRLVVGDLAAVEPELLRFGWEAVVEGTPHEGAALEVDWRPARQVCEACGEIPERTAGSWLKLCPRCELPLRIEGGQELELRDLTYETADEAAAELPNRGPYPMTDVDIPPARAGRQRDRRRGALRERWRASGTLAVNLISSPGSGKTTLLEATASRLKDRFRLGVIEGDIATELDADRLRRPGVPGAPDPDRRRVPPRRAPGARSRPTGASSSRWTSCSSRTSGNLICPTSYDLGEDFKVVVLSVTEGEDKPFKYPAIFSRAEVDVITKTDLLPHVPFKLDAVREQIRTLRPDGTLLELSARTGEGVDAWCALLEQRMAAVAVAR